MNRKRLIFAVLGVVLILGLVSGCATLTQFFEGKYKQLYAVADWTYKNHASLQARYDAATEEEQDYLYHKVNPYMNILYYGVQGLAAADLEDDVRVGQMIANITREVTRGELEYDPANLILALRTQDYTLLEVEVVILKNLIIGRLI